MTPIFKIYAGHKIASNRMQMMVFAYSHKEAAEIAMRVWHDEGSTFDKCCVIECNLPSGTGRIEESATDVPQKFVIKPPAEVQ